MWSVELHCSQKVWEESWYLLDKMPWEIWERRWFSGACRFTLTSQSHPQGTGMQIAAPSEQQVAVFPHRCRMEEVMNLLNNHICFLSKL